MKIMTNMAKLRDGYRPTAPQVEFDESVLEEDIGAALRDKPRKTIYLSGPMKGYPESNYPLFHQVAADLRKLGHDVYNPAEFQHDGPHDTFPIRKAFAAYCAFICNEADTIVLLPGYEKSKGATAELALARNCGLDVVELKFALDLFV